MRKPRRKADGKREPERPRPRSRARWLLLALLLAAAWAATADAPKATENDVKAAYLYNFGKFVKWPGAPGDQFPICVFGHDPFGALLDATVAGEKIEGKPVVARRIRSPQEATACRVLFIGDSERNQFQKVLDDAGKGVLTVSDIRGFARHGGMIEFVKQQNRIRFEVNLAVARRAGLVLSSELLKVASAVHRNGSD
jgi:YfiR/HmsC-like